MKEGITEWRSVAGAMRSGIVQELSEVNADITDLGGCVEGVRMSLVRAISRGERIMLASPAAETAIARDIAGDSEVNISYFPRADDCEEKAENCDVRPGSGKENTAARNDLENEVRVDSRIE